ncbi:MAG: ABC transporter substrate-binding protein [Limnohabitans sp.]|nr:ABC transporter substrate-binding protein [Limnohabitans sp.]
MSFIRPNCLSHLCAAAVITLSSSAVMAQETFKIGIVSFLSGQAAESFGIPAVNGAKVLIDAFNKGQAPAPYNKPGIGGMQIEAIYVDEAGGATKQVQELRNLYERDKVDVVVGYVGSGDCLAVAPVAEELKKFLILYDCGTPRIFEENNFKYVFRTASHAAMDNVSMARYLKSRKVPVSTYSMINQDYAWGQDSRKDFMLSMANLYPDAKTAVDQLPKFSAGQYGTEISALMSQPADLIHSSLWGGDLQAFILQSGPRGMFKKSQVVLTAADHVLPGLGNKMPDGTIIGARGAYGLMAPPSPLNTWWWDLYSKANNVYPVQAPYRMAQALMGLKLAAEKAMQVNKGQKPTMDQMMTALRGSEWMSPAGKIRMVLGNGQQAIQDSAIGRTKWSEEKKMVLLEDIQHFDAECVNPPPNIKTEDWLKSGFAGAKCK